MEESNQVSKPASDIVLGGMKFAPEGEPLKFHITGVSEGTGKNFDTGVEEFRVVVDAMLDSEVEGQGQVYRLWLKNSLHPKSTMAKLLKAVTGETKPASGSDLIGMPFQGILKPNEAGTRQNFESFLKPDKSQNRVDVEVVPTSLNDEIDLDSLNF